MLTEKLYYKDSKIYEFDATVIAKGDGYVVLDRTAFFPEGGGQNSDTGFIGEAKVSDVQEIDGEIRHFVDKEVEGFNRCVLNKEERWRKMQMHTGEHIICAVAHNLYGVDNVGFHLGDIVTMDLSGEVDVERIEKLANEAVRDNLSIKTYFPDNLDFEYRSKLELTENVRIVEIEGLDKCACCAPHVETTGEVGLIKVLSSMRHRGGTRIELVCGMDAFEYVCRLQKQNDGISRLLSVPRFETLEAVEKLLSEKDNLAYRMNGMEMKIAQGADLKDPIVCADVGEDAQRELCNRLMEVHDIAAVLSRGKYVIGSKAIDLKKKIQEINASICGRGGGKSGMVMGSFSISEDEAVKKLKDIL